MAIIKTEILDALFTSANASFVHAVARKCLFKRLCEALKIMPRNYRYSIKNTCVKKVNRVARLILLKLPQLYPQAVIVKHTTG